MFTYIISKMLPLSGEGAEVVVTWVVDAWVVVTYLTGHAYLLRNTNSYKGISQRLATFSCNTWYCAIPKYAASHNEGKRSF